MDEQIPEDLGIEEQDIEILDLGKVQLPLPLIYFNPGDYFSVIVFFDSRVETNPEPYGRVRGIHDLFHEVEAPAIGQTPQPSSQTYLGFAATIISALITVVASALVAYWEI